jgi:hypothetical protein
MTVPESTRTPDSNRAPPDGSGSAFPGDPALVADSRRALRAVRRPDDGGPALDALRGEEGRR